MFWFLVALLLFFLLMDQRKAAKTFYKKGVADGESSARARVEMVLREGDRVDSASVRQALDQTGYAYEAPAETEPNEVTYSQAAEVGDSSAVAAEATPLPDYPAATPEPELTPEQVEAEREQQTIKNLNIMLYVGSFLIVAAAALFVNLTMPAAVKLGGMLLVTVAFYTAGLVLHARSERLKAAALAFVGTGLAILPFIGFALTNLTDIPGQAAWWLTSIVGLAAYGLAAVRLQSQMVSYLTMAFMLSLALSTVSTMGLALVWYFVVVIGVSLLCNSLHVLWPQAMPSIFAKPIEQTGQVATPVALVASFLAASDMDVFMYQILYGVATLHYIVTWLQTRLVWYELAARVLGHVTLLLVAWDMSQDWNAPLVYAGAWLALAVVQVGYSLYRVQVPDADSRLRESMMLMASLGLLVVNLTLWQGVAHEFWWLSLNLLAIGLASLAAALRLRQAGWLYVGLAASLALVMTLGRLAIEPALPYDIIAGVFVALAAIVLVVLERARAASRSEALQLFYGVAAVAYAIFVVLCGIWSGETISVAWTTLSATAILAILSYLVLASVVAVEAMAAVLGVASVAAWVSWVLKDDLRWQVLISVVVSAALLAAAAYIHHIYRQRDRRDIMAVLAAGVAAGLVLTAVSSDIAVLRAATGLLIAGGAVSLGLRLVAPRQSVIGQTAMVGYVGYPILALMVAAGLGGGWLALALVVQTVALWASSYIEQRPKMIIVGNLMLIISLNVLWSWLRFDEAWRFYGIAWIVSAVYYIMYWLDHGRNDSARRQLSFVSIAFVLGLASMRGLFDIEANYIVAAACSTLVLAAVVAVHGYLVRQKIYTEIAIYIATVGLQRLVALAIPESNMVLFAHWWAIVIALVALWRQNDKPGETKTRMMIALGLVTGSTGLFALGEGGGYALLFLIEHLVIAVAGALLGKQWVLWWGVSATVLAILYFLRDYTAVALMFLGFLLILFVIWRLLKVGDKPKVE